MVTRRAFIGTVAAALPALRGSVVAHGAPSAVEGRLDATQTNEWGSPVFDLHHHMRPSAAANITHVDGAGITKANLLTRGPVQEQVKAVQALAPGRFTWFSTFDITKPEAEAQLTQAVKDGAQGFGELKFHVAADGPELRRMYALAADLKVPVLVHFQEVDHFEGEGTWSSGFAKTFEGLLKAYPKTTFIGHADAFWANVSADYRNEAAYPSGPIARGGITDRLLGDYPNLFGDCSANSGNNMLSRDPAFTSDFVKRHQDKLLMGSDCSCADGHGGGVSQANNPAASRLAGKCVARETLTVLKKAASPEVFHKIVWLNAHKLLTPNSQSPTPKVP